MQSETFNEYKEDRISIRLNHSLKQKIERAAELDNRSITSFIIASALESADKILYRADQLTLTDRDWDMFYEALANPPEPNIALKDAFNTYKKMKIHSDV